MRRQYFRFALRSLVLAATTVALVGCKVTSEDIEYWKGTVKGPGKIVAVMVSDKYPMKLRTQAAMALVEMDHPKVDGVAELQRSLQRLDDKDRQKIVDGMVPQLQKLMKGGESAQQGDSERRGPPPKQVRAKDAAYLLITHATDESRKKLVDSVVGWYVEDFNKRSLAGNYSAEQVVRSLGAPAAKKLVEALNSHMPEPTLRKIAELIGELGDESTKEQAAKQLVKIEKEMETEEFLQWIEDRARKELKKQKKRKKGKDAKVEIKDKRVKAMAVLTREKIIKKGALPAMKHLSSQDVVAERLLEIASTDSKKKKMVKRRRKALQALEGISDEKYLDKILDLALDEDNPTGVRDDAFDRIADIGSEKAIPPLWSLVESKEKQRLRWRAGELVLALGGPEVASKFFERLPSGDEVGYAPEELSGYARRLSQMSQPPTDLVREQLDSDQWWDRVIALRYFERKGSKSDIPQMKELTDDDTEVNGPNWDEGDTVGKVASEAIKGLKKRLDKPSKDKSESKESGDEE